MKKYLLVSIIFGVLVFVHKTEAQPIYSGWYTNWPKSSAYTDLTSYAGQGAKIMLPYNCWWNQDTLRTYLDQSQSLGVKVWVDLRLHAWGSQGALPSEVSWKAFINAFKGYPAVQGWYIADEPEWDNTGAYTTQTIQKYYDWTRQADPDHPVAGAHAWRVSTTWMPQVQDILLDVYPNWGYGNTENEEFSYRQRESYKWWRDGKAVTDSRGQRIWAVPLGFGYLPGTTNPQTNVRDMSDAEHKYHTFSAIVLGYSGAIFWWDMNEAGMTQANPAMKANAARRFSEISQISKEMGNGATNAGITTSVPTSKLTYRYGPDSSAGTGAILAVNIARWDASDNNGETLNNVQFTLPADIRPSQVTVVGEGRTLTVTNGVFTDSFSRFAVHIYKFNLSSTPPPAAKKGDLNSDSKVDIIDLGIFLSNWGITTKPASDINQDGKVDIIDLGILLSNWG